MNDREVNIQSLIEKLENLLSILDDSGHPIAAIKVEEAILALKQEQVREMKIKDNS